MRRKTRKLFCLDFIEPCIDEIYFMEYFVEYYTEKRYFLRKKVLFRKKNDVEKPGKINDL
jgi:hypothetical protein